MAKKKNFTKSLAELLPEGLNEDLIKNIAKLLSEKVNEETEKVKKDLTRKTLAFVRGQIDQLKEQALKELELENDTFRNAQMFETVRSMFAVELSGDDEINAATLLGSVTEQQDQKLDILTKELDRVLTENTTLKNSLRVIRDKNKLLESSVAKITEDVNVEKESKGKTLSDSALIVSADTFKGQGKNTKKIVESKKGENLWLSPEVMEAHKALR